MGSSHRTHCSLHAATDQAIAFLTDRLTEDLARVWARSAVVPDPARHPGAAALVTVLDEHLTALAGGRLPARADLRIMFFGYGGHPDYDPGWSDLLTG